MAALPDGGLATKAAVLALVAVGITAFVYGAVALIVKADDAGLAMAASPATSAFGNLTRALGRGIVRGMPPFLGLLAVVGTAAMIWVGGGILVHGLETYGVPQVAYALHTASAAVAGFLPPALSGVAEWLVTAAGSGVLGLLVGGLLIPATSLVIAPLWHGLSRRRSAAA